MRAVVFLALAVLVTSAAEAKGTKARGESAKVRQKSALSVVWSWLTSGLNGITTISETPGDTTDRGVEFDPNGGPTVPVPSSMPRL